MIDLKSGAAMAAPAALPTTALTDVNSLYTENKPYDRLWEPNKSDVFMNNLNIDVRYFTKIK